MGVNFTTRLQNYCNEARKMIDAKDFTEFLANISKAELLAEDDKEDFAKVAFLKAQGFFRFSQHKKVVEYIHIPLHHCTGEEVFKLESYYGVSLGFVGEFRQARETFLNILQKAQGNTLQLVETYLNLIWLCTYIGKEYLDEEILKEVKEYLDSAREYIDLVPNNYKWKIYNGYSLYYYHTQQYEQAIMTLEEALKYCEEKNLTHLYTNFAEIYLKIEQEDVYSIIKEYTQKAEVLASEHDNQVGMARAFYIQAMSEVKADQLFTALDTLYLAFEYFKKAEAYPLAFDCLVKINELMNEYKVDRLKTLKESVKAEFKNTPFYVKL